MAAVPDGITSLPMRRLLLLALAAAALLALAAPAAARQDVAGGPVVVADVRGPLDQRALDFLEAAVATSDAQLVVVQMNSAGISSGDPAPLYEAVADSTTPIAIWVGPAGAVAYGGAGQLLLSAHVTGAAPGTHIGYLEPVVIGADVPGVAPSNATRVAEAAMTESILVKEGATTALIDEVVPTIGQFIASLDGRTIGGTTLETARQVEAEDGSTITVPSVEVRFVKPDLFTRFLRLASRPEAAFFFLLAGIAIATFEFYAAGVGIAAAVAALSLWLAGYGWATLPMNWYAVVLALIGLLLYTWDFQRNALGPPSIIGTGALLAGGFFYTSAAPQYTPAWWGVILTVVGIALFYGVALTTVVRSRFSTLTIGREYLVGKLGTAETDFDPEGVVVVDGARWRARSHRAGGLQPGDPVQVFQVTGILLEVGPPE
jgi:membrane-bound serine protease (ClpP class)